MNFLFLVSKLILFLSWFFLCSGRRTFEAMVETRDGVKLHTRVVLPRDKDGKYPALVVRSPYGYDDMEIYGAIYSIFGFAAIGQDWRGTGKSGGHFSDFQSEGQDGYDLVSWIQNQEWSNGEIYTFGASADGMASLLLLHDIGENKETIKREQIRVSKNITTVENSIMGQFFLLTTGESYPIFYPGGAYRHGLTDNWISDTVRPDDQSQATDLILSHETFDDWWANVDMDEYYKLVKWPTTFYAGWYDIFTIGNLVTYEGFQKLSDPSVRGKHNLVIDPCGHCQEADDFFDKNLLYGRTILAIFQNFQQFGILPQNPRSPKRITFYVMKPYNTSDDEPGNYFTTMDEWPEYTATDFYLTSSSSGDSMIKGKNIYVKKKNNAFELSNKVSSISEDSTITYTNDPTNPSPTIGGNNYMVHPCGPRDQSALDERDDIVSFTTPPLTEPLAITGPLNAQLYISSTAKDTDMTLRLTDYNPNTGEAQLIQDGIVRMRNRDPSNPELQLLEPDVVYKADISLWNTSYIFPKGHQVKVFIGSTNYPRFSTNNQTGVNIKEEFSSAKYVVANNTLYLSEDYPSKIILPVIPNYESQLPEFKAVDYAEELAEAIYNKFPHIKTELKWDWNELMNQFDKLYEGLRSSK